MTYNKFKELEYKMLFFLNNKQPIEYFNTQTNSFLPISPYYLSLCKYSKFDISNEYITIELKTRKHPIEFYNDDPISNTLSVDKIISNHSIFMFSYDFQTQNLNNISFINYDRAHFEQFQITPSKYGDLFVIPRHNLIEISETGQPHSHRININYTEHYKEFHLNLLKKDKEAYINNFGFYNF